jgi:CheY-like chemotaxis protein
MIKPRPLEVNQLVRDVERMLTRVIGEHIELRADLHPDSGWIYADLNQMEGVLLNLATNARDAMDQGGVLTIETVRVDISADHPARDADMPAGSYVRLVVRDTGHGMDYETKQRLFEPFYTTKERGRGTGLGLPSVLGGIEQNQGRIFVASEPGKGSEFSIYLPRIESPDLLTPGTPAISRQLISGSETILLVEDEVAVRRMLREALSKVGYRVWEAGNGAEAIEQWAREIERIDLVVTDVVMPVMNGLRLIEELRKLRPGIRVVCMSGHSEDILGHQSSSDAAPELLRKPFLPDVLVRKVREMLDQPASGTTMPPRTRDFSGLR